MTDVHIQWHSAFVAAMQLELIEYSDNLIYHVEHTLNTKPLQIDFLVIKKNSELPIGNEIGVFFRKYNIMEFKSPKDKLNIDTLYKAQAYACLYKSYSTAVDGISASDITISLVRDTKPKGLFSYFKEHGIKISNPHNGIYYIEGFLFPIQIIVTIELNRETHIWLTSLSERLNKPDMRRLLEYTRRLTGKHDRELADSVLEVSLRANDNLFKEVRGDDNMSEELLEMLKPVIEPAIRRREEKAIEQATEQVTEKNIISAVKILKGFGHSNDDIKAAIMENYHLSETDAMVYLH